jgi:hypothetical protein
MQKAAQASRQHSMQHSLSKVTSIRVPKHGGRDEEIFNTNVGKRKCEENYGRESRKERPELGYKIISKGKISCGETFSSIYLTF